MNTIAFFAAAVVLGLIVLAKLPGLEHTVRPIIDLVFSLIKTIAESSTGWLIWMTKAVWGAHAEVVQHLVHSAESIDPTHAMRDETDKG